MSVPRMLNRFNDLIKKRIDQLEGAQKSMAETGLQTKLAAVESNGACTNFMYDQAIFNRFQAILGGKVRLIMTGAAPLHPTVQNMLKVTFCCPVVQAYGQTESSGAITISFTTDNLSGHCGGPIKTCEVKLVDVPEMNYFSKNVDADGKPLPQGEICFRGQNAFQGYFKNKEETAAIIDAEGFIHTGDVGQIHENGSIKIVDRIKNIFKLSHGEYICPTRLEEIFGENQFINQIFVYGDSFQNYLVTVIVPDKEMVTAWAMENEMDIKDYEAILKAEATKEHFIAIMKEKAKEKNLFGFEVPTKILLTSTEFSSDNDMLTPTFK